MHTESIHGRVLREVEKGTPDAIIFKKYNLNEQDFREILKKNIRTKHSTTLAPVKIQTKPAETSVNEMFHTIARKSSDVVGSPWSFIIATSLLIVWAITGPAFNYSDTWQLIINTATTIVTFLMVFLIQNTQNRNDKATQLKLDELIRAVEGARTGLVNLETRTDSELEDLQSEFEDILKKEIRNN